MRSAVARMMRRLTGRRKYSNACANVFTNPTSDPIGARGHIAVQREKRSA